MSAPYVPSVFVPGQQSSSATSQQSQQSQYGQAYVPSGQQQPVHHSTTAAYGQTFAPGQPTQQLYNVNQSQVYVPGQPEPAMRGQQQSYVPGVQQQQPSYGGNAYVPGQEQSMEDPNGERGLLANTAKIGLGVGAAALAYNAYNQYQQQQQNMAGQPMQLQQDPQYGQPAYGQPSQQQTRKGVLTIYLDRCTNLANKDFLSKSDPYVKLSIEQDNWVRDIDYGKQYSSRKTDQLNPVYNEVFHFNLPTLENMVLKIKVMDDDGGFTRDDKLGGCKIKLWELNLTNNPMALERVIDRNIFTQHGKVVLRLSYSGKL